MSRRRRGEAYWRRVHAHIRASVDKLHPEWSEERKESYVYGRKTKMGWRRKG